MPLSELNSTSFTYPRWPKGPSLYEFSVGTRYISSWVLHIFTVKATPCTDENLYCETRLQAQARTRRPFTLIFKVLFTASPFQHWTANSSDPDVPQYNIPQSFVNCNRTTMSRRLLVPQIDIHGSTLPTAQWGNARYSYCIQRMASLPFGG